MKNISSASNPRYKALQRLVHSSQERKKRGLSVLDGARLVAAYREQGGTPEEVVISRSASGDPQVLALLRDLVRPEPVVLSDALFASVSSVATPSGIIAVVKTPSPQPVPREMDSCVMLEGLQDPGNLGSILRSCAAAGVRHVLLSKGTVHAWSPRVLRAAMGAHFALNIYEHVDLPQAAEAFPGKRVATDQRAARTLYAADLTGRVALIFGTEGRGLSPWMRSVADEVVAIPLPGAIESLNVAAAAAVCLFERVRQLHGHAQ
jgi:TrmH family RNA methyltransferase